MKRESTRHRAHTRGSRAVFHRSGGGFGSRRIQSHRAEIYPSFGGSWHYGAVATDREAELLSIVGDRSTSWTKRSTAAAELGGIRGDDRQAERVLRKVLSETPTNSGLQAPCLIALARRAGASALDVYLDKIKSRSEDMRHYALCALASIDYGLQWEDQFSRLKHRVLRKQGMSHGNWSSYVYLILTGHQPEERTRLIELIRSQWDDLPVPDQHFLPNVWTGIQPGTGPLQAPDVAAIREAYVQMDHPR